MSRLYVQADAIVNIGGCGSGLVSPRYTAKPPKEVGVASNYFPVPNCAQVDMIYHQGPTDNKVENVYHVGSNIAKDQTWLASLATVFENWENTSMKSHRATNVQLEQIIVRDLASANGQVYTRAENITGTRVGTHLPSGNTWAIKWSTGMRGRSFRGRTFHIGITLADIAATDDQTIDPTQGAAIVAAYQALITNVGTFGATLVVVQRRSNNAWINPPLTHTITTATYTDLYVDSQRRRLLGHNRHR